MRGVRHGFVCGALLVAASAFAQDAGQVLNFFARTAQGLAFDSGEWSAQADGQCGFVSLKIRDAEFLARGKSFGGFAFRCGDRLVTRFPVCDNVSHDEQVGRIGSVADGVFLLQVKPSWVRPEFSLYAGFNAKEDHQLVMFLGDDVALLRQGTGDNRSGLPPIAASKDGEFQSPDGLTLVHKKGYALLVKAPCKGGPVTDPDGKKRLALTFACKGFAANNFPFTVEPLRRAENFMFKPQFRVVSSGDNATEIEGNSFVAGVGYPVYGRDTLADFNIDFTWLGNQPFNGYAEMEIVHALGATHYSDRKPIKDAAPGAVSAHFDPKFTMPGVSDVWGRLLDADGRLLWVSRYRMLYDWEHYQPKTTAQPDMKAFWDETLKTLRAAPLDPVTERVKQFEDHPTFEIFTVTYAGWEGKRIHAMLFVPKAHAKPMPAIVTAHPGTTGFGVNKRPDGVYGSEVKQDPRFVTIVPLIRGHAPDAKDIPFNNPWWGSLDSRDAYVARSWYCAMVRAVDYLATRPELVDINRIVARGGSQGGALALVTAALDPRIKLCLADSPSNCQLHEILENYGSFGPSRGQIPAGQTLQDLEKTLSYYDPVNLCPWIKCPTYVSLQVGDLTVHSMGGLAAYHNLTAQKGFYAGPSHFHAGSARGGKKFEEELEKLLWEKRP